jgi:MFS family permease
MTDKTSDAPKDELGGNVYRFYVLFTLMFAFMFNITDRLAMSIVIEDIKTEFLLSDTQIGLLAGFAFTIFYVLLGIPAGRLADRTNRKKMVAVAVSLWSLMAALCGLAVGFWTLFLARLGVGVGEAGGGPPSVSILSDYFAPQELSKVMGIFALGAVFGPTLGFIAGGYLAEAYGWRWMFIILGLPGVLLGVIIYLTVKEPKRGRYVANEKEAVEPARQEPFWTTMLSLGKNKIFVRVVIANALTIITGYTFSIWLAPILIRNFAIAQSDVGLYLGLAWLAGGIPGMVLGGMISDRLARRNSKWRSWVCAITVALALPMLCACLFMEDIFWMLALYTIGYGLMVAAQGPSISMIQVSVTPTERATASSFSSLLATFLGYAIAPAIVGIASDILKPGYQELSLNYAVFFVVAVSLILGSLGYIWASKAFTNQQEAAVG